MASWGSTVFSNAWITMNGSWGNAGNYNMSIYYYNASDYGTTSDFTTLRLEVRTDNTENNVKTIGDVAVTTSTLSKATFTFNLSSYVTPASLQVVLFRIRFIDSSGNIVRTVNLVNDAVITVTGIQNATMAYVKANEPPSTLTFTTSNSNYQDFTKPLTLSWNAVTQTGSFAPHHYKIWIRFSYDDGATWVTDNNYIGTGWGVEGTSYTITLNQLKLDTKNLDRYGRFKLRIGIATVDNASGNETTRSSVKWFVMTPYVINTSNGNLILHTESNGQVTIGENNTKRITSIDDMKVKILDDGSEWARIFWHDVSSDTTYFTDSSEAGNCNLTNRFSRLTYVWNYRYNDKYEFMLCYPRYSTTKYNRWIQTANPLYTNSDGTQTAETMGYQGIHIDFTTQWKYGMGLSISSQAFMDCEAGTGYWYGGIGLYSAYKGGFPAPTESGMNNIQTEVELWIRINRDVKVTPKDNKRIRYISTGSDLTSLITEINANPTSFENKIIKLKSNIDLGSESSSFTPIENFYGIFDGSGFKINCALGKLESSGGTGVVDFIKNNYGTIKNLILGGERVILNVAPSTEFGGICNINYGLVSNCINERSIYPAGTATNAVVGGFVGLNNGGSVSRCILDACIGMSKESGAITGGIVGRNKGIIEGCRGEEGFHQGNIVGGICGYTLAGSIIRNCCSTDYLEANSSGYMGGIVGYSYKGEIINCYSANSRNSLGMPSFPDTGYYGGICGYNNYGTYSNNYYDSAWGKGSNEYNSGVTSGASIAGSAISGSSSSSLASKLGNAYVSYYNINDFPSTNDAHTLYYYNSKTLSRGQDIGHYYYIPLFSWEKTSSIRKSDSSPISFNWYASGINWETALILTGNQEYGKAKYVEITWGLRRRSIAKNKNSFLF